MKPYISVIVTAYKPRPFIIEALQSIIKQTIPREWYEIILVSNFENEQIRKFSATHDIKFCLSQLESQGGKIAQGALLCAGDLVSFLEDDDLFVENRLEKVIQKFSSDKELVFYHSNVGFIDEAGNTVSPPNALKSPLMNIEAYGSVRMNVGDLRNGVLESKRINPCFNLSAISVTKNFLRDKAELISKVDIGLDVILFLLAVQAGSLLVDKEVLSLYRRHNQNSSLDNSLKGTEKAEYMLRMLKIMRDSREIALNVAEKLGISSLTSPRAFMFYGSEILYGIVSGNAKRNVLATNFFKYIAKSPLHLTLTRIDLMVYSLSGLVSPSLVRKIYLRRHS